MSFVLPVTSFGYAMNAFMSWRLLGEHVSITRWVGTIIICVGVATVSRTEQRTTSPEPGGAAMKKTFLLLCSLVVGSSLGEILSAKGMRKVGDVSFRPRPSSARWAG